MKAIDTQRCAVRRSGKNLLVESPYWTVRHDLGAGGCWDSITFTHGGGENLLAGPVGGRIRCREPHPTSDSSSPYFYAEANDRHPDVRVTEGAEGPIVTVEGRYQLAKAPPAGAGVPRMLPIRFRRRYEYRLWGIVACELEVSCDEPCPGVVEVVVADIVLREGMTDALVRDNPDMGSSPDGTSPGKWLKLPNRSLAHAGDVAPAQATSFMNGLVPIHICCFQKGGEGLEFMPGSDLSQWNSNFCRQSGLGNYTLQPAWDNPDHTLISLAPYCLAYRRNPITLQGSYKLRYYIGLPSIKPRGTVSQPWFHVYADSRWLSDADLEKLARSGIKLVRFHNDYREEGPFWHDGVYPPYDPAGMAELRRIIDTSHRLGMKAITYVSVKEFHPESPDFPPNQAAWSKECGPEFKELHTWYGSGEFGQLMCLESGWLDFRKKSVDIILNDLPWDGLYFDWCTPHPCRHAKHVGGATHTDQDAFLDFMCWCRKRVGPDGIIMTHLSGLPQIVIENMSDVTTIHEEAAGASRPTNPAHFPVQCTFIPITPRFIHGWGFGPDQRRCAMVSLLQGHPALGPGSHLYSFWDGIAEFVKEYRFLSEIDFPKYKFAPATEGWVKTGDEEVFGAVWHRAGEAIVYLVNMSSRRVRGAAALDPMHVFDSVVRKLAVQRKGAGGAIKISALQLKTKGVPYTLKPFESCLITVTLPSRPTSRQTNRR